MEFQRQESGSEALKLALESNSLDKQEDTEEILKSGVNLVRYLFASNNSIYVAGFKNALMFSYNKASVRGKDRHALKKFAQLYTKGTFGKYLYVIGHTDSDGSEAYNYKLSARRARAVASVLLKNGYEKEQLSLVPAGEYLPKASNKTKDGKQENRRVEIVSANSRALIQSYLRQLKCPPSEKCKRKLLNVFGVRKVKNTAAMSLRSKRTFATFSPELNNLSKLENALKTDSRALESQLLNTNDQRSLVKLGQARRAFSIPVEVRPTLELRIKRRRGLKLPKQQLIKK